MRCALEHLLTGFKMPSESSVSGTPTEKPHHYTYLKEFRTQQCPLFLQHKCTQHRPYTCFHWHFMNQRRRRPVRKRDGTFGYSPDVYCTKYDETTGICPEGDDCPLLHRTAGDTERRYHLRYYKTCTCVYETDVRGHCVKNGAHCAFAHGAQDLRPPLYDVRELQEAVERQGFCSVSESPLGSSLEKDRIINEDPKWNDTNYVLANYKTEQCKRPPRLCRQGYACPSYHNTRDRRRSPKKNKYRSTPCPNVKHGDDWGDPTQCENGDGCAYCHTRTEQQFHPEIYKSTKCNDMVQTGYCPRGPFCAFAHVEHEMTTQRDVGSPGETSLAAFMTNALSDVDRTFSQESNNNDETKDKENGKSETSLSELNTDNGSSNGDGLAGSCDYITTNSLGMSYCEPIGKGRTSSFSSSVTSESSLSSYLRAPGSEREETQTKLRHQLQTIENDPMLDSAEKSKRKQNLLLLHNLNIGSPGNSSCPGSTTSMSPMSAPAGMSPHAPSFYPPGDTVESVIGNALEEDLNLGEISLGSLDREMRDNDNDTNSVCSSLSTGFPANTGYATSVPVTIPSGGYQRNSLGSLSQSPSSSPIGSLPLSFAAGQHLQQELKIQEAAAAFLSQPNPGKFSAPGFPELNSMSPRSGNNVPSFNMNSYNDIQRLREELSTNKAKLAQWEEGIGQARNACEAWKKEAEEATRRAKIAEDERKQATKQRDEVVTQMTKLKQELDQLRAASILGAVAAAGGPFLQTLARKGEFDVLNAAHIKQMQAQIRQELENQERMNQQQQIKCSLCQDKDRSVHLLPCSHLVICESCTIKLQNCPICHSPINVKSNILPL